MRPSWQKPYAEAATQLQKNPALSGVQKTSTFPVHQTLYLLPQFSQRSQFGGEFQTRSTHYLCVGPRCAFL
jgi:hypothetical protein